VEMKDVVRLLEEAGKRIVLPTWKKLRSIETKLDGSVITEVDLACETFIQKGLKQPGDTTGFLSEEMTAEEQRDCLKNGGRYWCLDPLDGTSNFATTFPVFSISLALIEEGKPIMAAIHDPVRGESFYGWRQRGAWLNGMPLRTSTENRLQASVGFIDFKRLEPSLAKTLVTGRFYRSQRNIGSCALEWSWLAAGRAQFIIHGGEKLWDFAAGALLAREAGAVVSDFTGGDPLEQVRMKSSILASANKEVHRQLTGLLPESACMSC